MRPILIALAASLSLAAGAASAQPHRSAPASRTDAVAFTASRTAATSDRIDPNSALARTRAAIAQGFAPVDTDLAKRGFNR